MITTPPRRGRGLGPLPIIPGVRLFILKNDDWLAGAFLDESPTDICERCRKEHAEIWRMRSIGSFDGLSWPLCRPCAALTEAEGYVTLTPEFRCA